MSLELSLQWGSLFKETGTLDVTGGSGWSSVLK